MPENVDPPVNEKKGIGEVVWELLRASIPNLPWILSSLSLLILLGAGYLTPVTSTKQLTIVASLLPAGDHSEIKGRVLQDGDAVGQALVWAVVEYGSGQRASPPTAQTNEKGEFSIGPVPNGLTNEKDKAVEATVTARKQLASPWYNPWAATSLRGEDRVRAAGTVLQDIVELSPLKLAPLPLIFLFSAMLPFFGEPRNWKHVFAVILAFVFTGLMIGYLSLGLRYVSTAGKKQDILALGFASVYQTTYVKDVPPEWVFSFTAPPAKPAETPVSEAKPTPEEAASSLKTADKTTASTTSSPANTPPIQVGRTGGPKAQTDSSLIDHGFGAPLWVLLVSVVGAGVLTVALMVGEIRSVGKIRQMPAAQQPAEIREHLHAIVQHQVFILFAPLSGVFVYQGLVAGSAASSTYTVAIAALGAGPSLSALLTKAGAAAAGLFVPKN